jgi:signal transduction histidine kinase
VVRRHRQRRRLERRLRETVERRLAGLARRLEGGRAGSRTVEGLRGAQEQLARTRADLRDLAAGLDPVGAHEGGLSDALAALVARSPVDVTLDIAGTELSDEIATAVYFVCAEALANVVKYAGASHADVCIGVHGRHLRVVVQDDGAGGADPAAGTGLRGLADRLEALGGSLAVDSPSGHGTRVTAELPIGGDPR